MKAPLLLSLLFASTLFGQIRPGDPFVDPEYERVLLPVFFSGAGANGAQWETSIEVTTSRDDFFTLPQPALVYASDTRGGCLRTTVAPRMSARVCPELEHAAGLLLWVPRTVKETELHVSIRVRDTSKNATSAGTFVPVVRESDLTGDTMVLLDVPVDARFRTALRVYDAFGFPGVAGLTIYDSDDYRRGRALPLLDTTVTLDDPNPEPYTRHIRRPGFRLIGDLVGAYPQLAGRTSVTVVVRGSHPLVSPPLPYERFYALASVTNNATQEVTIISPR